MIENINNEVFKEQIISEVVERVSRLLDEKFEGVEASLASPYVNGINGLARYLGIGESLATQIKNNNEIAYSQRGREIWFRKSDIEKFMSKNRA